MTDGNHVSLERGFHRYFGTKQIDKLASNAA